MMKQWCLFLLLSMVVCVSRAQGTPDPDTCETQLAVLKDAVLHGETFFIKVHAAEKLLAHGHKENLELEFLKLRKVPANNVGASRVLTRIHHLNKQVYTTELISATHSDTPFVRLTAMESLAKLNYFFTSEEIRGYADTGTGAYKAMARWVLSNDGTPKSEDRLAALLASADTIDNQYAAYAFSYKTEVKPATLELLKKCYAKLAPGSNARVYVASSIFLHSPESEMANAKKALLEYISGTPAQLYELAEALAVAGTPDDLETLNKLTVHENRDVRVAAANAILNILNCRI